MDTCFLCGVADGNHAHDCTDERRKAHAAELAGPAPKAEAPKLTSVPASPEHHDDDEHDKQ